MRKVAKDTGTGQRQHAINNELDAKNRMSREKFRIQEPELNDRNKQLDAERKAKLELRKVRRRNG